MKLQSYKKEDIINAGIIMSCIPSILVFLTKLSYNSCNNIVIITVKIILY